MLRKIDSNEASTKFHEVLLIGEAGEAFTTTRNGKPIADVVPSRAGIWKVKNKLINSMRRRYSARLNTGYDLYFYGDMNGNSTFSFW